MEKTEYYSLNQYLKANFGCKVYKLSLDGGFTCPNRDGKIDTRGCIFCSAGGSGDFAESRSLSISEQIECGKKRVASKLSKQGDNKYIAYFQAFTNTYGPVEFLRNKYMEAVNHPEVVAVSIATRPDCLGDEVISLLSEINRIKPVWVELGLQTIHDKTSDYIRRGYDLKVYDEAVTSLKAEGIRIITHVILGLPGESREDMLETVKYVASTNTFGIKLQLLHVLKNTDLAGDYAAGKFVTLEEDEYLDLVRDCVALLPKDMVVHRLTGDGDKKSLIAPMWSADKKHVLSGLQKRLKERT